MGRNRVQVHLGWRTLLASMRSRLWFFGFIFVIIILVAVSFGIVACSSRQPAVTPPIIPGPGVTGASVASDGGETARDPDQSPGSGRSPFFDPGYPIKFQHLTVQQGLSQSTVTSILQDTRGFLWFATWEGLNKFDGYEFTVYRHDPDEPHSLSDNVVLTLLEDSQGVLWVGTANGLNRFDRDNERFERFQHNPDDSTSLSHNSVRQVLEDSSGMFWVATAGGGLNRMDRETGQFVRFRHDPENEESLSHDVVTAILEDNAGALWVATVHGLNRYFPEGERFVRFRHDPDDPKSLSNDRVFSLQQDHLGVIWVGTAGGGLNRLDAVTAQFTHFRNDPDDAHSLSSDAVSGIFEDRSGTLWVLTDEGVNRFDRKTGQFTRYQNDLRDPHSLGDNAVNTMYQDRAGMMWIGTGDAGVGYFDPSSARFRHYKHDPNDANSLNDNMVWSIVHDEDDVLWIGTEEGLNRFDRESGEWRHYRNDRDDVHSLSSNNVTSLLLDRDGALWIGTDKGLDRFNRTTEQIEHYRHDPDDDRSLSNNFTIALYEDREGDLWIGTYGGGLNKLNRASGTFIRYLIVPDDPGNPRNIVWKIAQDGAGYMWIGTPDGLVKFDEARGEFHRYAHDPEDPQSLSDNRVLMIHQDHNDVMWIGTFGGLNRFDPETESFAHYRVKDGLPNDVIYGILEDDAAADQGGPFLWLSTNKGLSRFAPRTGTFESFGVSDGIQSSEFNSNAYFKSSTGEMFFGGVNGLNAFFPEEIRANPYIPPVVLVSLSQSGEELDVGVSKENLKEVEFRWPNNFFEFEIAALSFSQPDKNQYAYILEGFDKDWNDLGTRRFGRYTNLPGGTYILRVKASNSDGVWNEDGASIKISVVPPIWETWWFRGFMLFGLIATVVGGVQIRVRTIAARNRELEAQVVERTRALEQRTHELQERTHELEQQTHALKRRGKQLAALYRAEERMHHHLHLDQVLQELVDVAVDILQADKSAVLVWDEAQKSLVAGVARGFHPERMADLTFAPGEGTTGHVAVSGEPVVVEDALNDPGRVDEPIDALAVVDAEGIRSFMHLPILVDDHVFAVFNVSYLRPNAISDDERRLFLALAQRAALAIENAQLYEKTQELAKVEERGRLARDLHDAVTQTLFSASLIAETLPAMWECNKEEGRQLLTELRQLSRGALAEMRTLLMELRPAALAEANLGDLLRQLGEAVTGRTGMTVDVKARGRCLLPTDVHVALYRIAQEALNNAVKHARADQVEICLDCVPSSSTGDGCAARVELRVKDNGRGFDPNDVSPERLGLNIVRERALAVGAELTIDSQPGQGTRIAVRWVDDE